MDPTSKKRTTSPSTAPARGNNPATGGTPPAIVVDQLTSVVRNRTGQEVYLGWGPDGNAAITPDRQAISSSGRDILRVYDSARNLPIRDLPYSVIMPVEYGYIKLKDLGGAAEDYFFVNVKDWRGEPEQYRVGELELLEGIVNARTYLQDTSATGEIGERIVPTEPVYTVITRCFEIDDKYTALAIMFKPPMENVPQEATFQHFVVSVLRSLWQNDMQQVPSLRKGYYDAAQDYLPPSQTRVPLLLRLAFTSEDTARKKWEAIRRWIYKQPDASLGSNQADSLDQLDMDHLFSLALSMRDSARTFFLRNSASRRT